MWVHQKMQNLLGGKRRGSVVGRRSDYWSLKWSVVRISNRLGVCVGRQNPKTRKVCDRGKDPYRTEKETVVCISMKFITIL